MLIQTPVPDEHKSIMNHDAFDRLYWSVLDPAGILSVQVAEDNEDASPCSRAYLIDHPIALEPATTTNANKLIFTAKDLGVHASECHMWSDGFEEPEDGVENLEDAWNYFVIETEDGSPLLIRDVVDQFHAWANSPFIEDKIRESLLYLYNAGSDNTSHVPEGVKIFLESVEQYGSYDGACAPVVYVNLWVEGYEDKDAEYFWKSRVNPRKYSVE
ncbi:hypothetical protein J4E89_009581 [Alternaria sp. Ai002NY15]|nr:hypothetical protein J4E89_009581 [Alternaria sp. Ai002NY15]